FAGLHHLVETQADLRALAVAKPADAGRQALELDALARQPQPAMEVLVIGKRLHDGAIGAIDVLWVAAQRDPAKWALSLAEQRPDVGRYEARDIEGVGDARLERETAQVVAVIEGLDALPLEAEHGPDMLAHRMLHHLQVFLRIACSQVGRFVDAQRRRGIAT